VLIWTAEDVLVLADGASLIARGITSPSSTPKASVDAEGDKIPTAGSTASAANTSALASATHAGKYSVLYRWLRIHERKSVVVTFAEVEEILGFPLPNSCRKHVPHWHSYEGSAVAQPSSTRVGEPAGLAFATRQLPSCGWTADAEGRWPHRPGW